jgi:flagellar basal body-associated protein FliL
MDEGTKKIVIAVVVAALMVAVVGGMVWYWQGNQETVVPLAPGPAVAPAAESVTELEKEVNNMVIDDSSEDFSSADTEGL